MKKYSFSHWNIVLESPDSLQRDSDLRLIGSMARGNLQWFARRLMGKTNDPAYYFARNEMARRSSFLDYMERLDEDTLR